MRLPNLATISTQVCLFQIAGSIRDCLVGEREIAQYFLAILNSSDEYKKWAKLAMNENDRTFLDLKVEGLSSCELDKKQKRQYPTDHTQVSVIRLSYLQKIKINSFAFLQTFKINMLGKKCCISMLELVNLQKFPTSFNFSFLQCKVEWNMNVLVNRSLFFQLEQNKNIVRFHREANFMPDTEVEEGGGGWVEDL